MCAQLPGSDSGEGSGPESLLHADNNKMKDIDIQFSSVLMYKVATKDTVTSANIQALQHKKGALSSSSTFCLETKGGAKNSRRISMRIIHSVHHAPCRIRLLDHRFCGARGGEWKREARNVNGE